MAALGLAAVLGAHFAPERECPVTHEADRHEDKQEAKHAEVAAASSVAEVKPKVITIVKRVPVVLPGAGCPVGIEETTTTETTADSRITQAAVKGVIDDVKREKKDEHEVTREATERDWTAGVFVGSRTFVPDRSNLVYSAVLGRRVLGRLSLAIIGQWQREAGFSAGAGVTYGW